MYILFGRIFFPKIAQPQTRRSVMIRNIFTIFMLSLFLGACATPSTVAFQKTERERDDEGKVVSTKTVTVNLVCSRGRLVYDDSFSEKNEHDRYACQYEDENGQKKLGKPRELAGGQVGGQTFFGMNLGLGGGGQFPYGSRVACPQVMVGNGMARCQ